MSYGIGRVPRDVDPTSEALAEVEAAEIMGQAIASGRSRIVGTCSENTSTERGQYVKCGQPLDPHIYQSSTPGCKSNCEEHFLAYHKQLGHGGTVDEIIAYYERLARRTGPCGVCGKATNNWVSGAGRYLCPRHQDDY